MSEEKISLTQKKDDMCKSFLSKVVISVGLGGKSKKEILDVKNHIENLLLLILETPRKFTQTTCKKSIATFKVRKGIPMGLKLTLRNDTAKKFLKVVLSKLGYTKEKVSSLSWDNRTLSLGLNDHKRLKLQKYNPNAPEYGFSIFITFENKGARVKYRRINPVKLKYEIPRETCNLILSELCI